MTLELWLHFAHVAGAIVWVGGGVILSLVGVRVRRSGNLGVVGEFAQTLSYVGLRVFTPAVVVVFVSGVWLVLSSGWNFTQLWVLLGLGAFVLAFLIGAVYLSRNAIQLERAVSQNADLTVAREALRRWLVGYGVVLIILVFALWDMIFKHGTWRAACGRSARPVAPNPIPPATVVETILGICGPPWRLNTKSVAYSA